ncbi:MAG: NADAR family protein [Endozoicomonadaceae bacterium]|nr:NADAR family protein [Endozoicomonadaceae bacterium]
MPSNISQTQLYNALQAARSDNYIEEFSVSNFGWSKNGRIVKTSDPEERLALRNAINKHCCGLRLNPNEFPSKIPADADHINIGILAPELLKKRKISKVRQICTYILGKCQLALQKIKSIFTYCCCPPSKSSHSDIEEQSLGNILGNQPISSTDENVNSTIKISYLNFIHYPCTTHNDWLAIKARPEYTACTTEVPTNVMPNYDPSNTSHCGFYYNDSQHGPYCYTNYHKGQYPIRVDDKEYQTAEHLFQAAKFKESDPERAEDIRKASSPGIAKQIASRTPPDGKIYKNSPSFDASSWDTISNTVMLHALFSKASQDPEYRKALFESAKNSQHLYELAPNDKRWGIGINYNTAVNNAKRKVPMDSKDYGTNWLGKDHMYVREQLINGRIQWEGIGDDPIKKELTLRLKS